MNFLIGLVCVAGIASQYAPGVMDGVIRNRQSYHQLSVPLPKVDGYLAMYNCARIGDIVFIGDEKFLITDCAGDKPTRDWMERNNIVAELDYETALRWDTIGRGKHVSVCEGVINGYSSALTERRPVGLGKVRYE